MTITKAKALRELITSSKLEFLMECHNGLSAKIAEEAGFKGLWGSGLSISAACGVRDNNEMSWTQVLEIMEYISDATDIPLLLDGDTGYGNFNNMRRLVSKLESRSVAGVCIEDKLFPKQNSFLEGGMQALADIEEFCGKIKAGKDAQKDDDFVIVARVEAFIAGRGLAEALNRAHAYREAGADAILMHSKIPKADEVLLFKREWDDGCPVIIVPTKYYSTPTDVFRQAGFSIAIWANHLMRTCITAMQQTAKKIHDEETLLSIEEKIVTVSEVFRLQGAEELKSAEQKYLPKMETTTALVLAASRGTKLGDLTADKPKTMLPISGKSLLSRMTETLQSIGIDNITVVRGYKKEAIDISGLRYVDNDRFEATKEVYSMYQGLKELSGEVLVAYGDILYHKHLAMNLLDTSTDFAIAVDANWQESLNRDRYGDYVVSDTPFSKYEFDKVTYLEHMTTHYPEGATDSIHGEWVGLLKISTAGLERIMAVLKEAEDNGDLAHMRMTDLFNTLIERGEKIEVIYHQGHWVDVDELGDVLSAGSLVSR